MAKKNSNALVRRCNRLTSKGETLSVTWNGGHDSGWFELKQNGKTISDDYEDPLIKLVADVLDYGSFAGDFNTDGEVTYNRETKRFEGIDSYSETEQTTFDCNIEVRIPNNIWFDQVIIHIEANESALEAVTARLFVKNGPRIELHDQVENAITEMVHNQVSQEIKGIENLDSMWQDITIEHDQMKLIGESWVHTVEELSYNYTASVEKQINISVTDKSYTYESI